MDKNHDGVLDVNEIAALVPAVDVSQAVMRVADGDESGGIDRAEWESSVKAVVGGGTAS